MEIEDEAAPDATESQDSQKVFLNPSTRDTLLSDLVNGSYNAEVIKGSKGSGSRDGTSKQVAAVPQAQPKANTTVATRDPNLAASRLHTA